MLTFNELKVATVKKLVILDCYPLWSEDKFKFGTTPKLVSYY